MTLDPPRYVDPSRGGDASRRDGTRAVDPDGRVGPRRIAGVDDWPRAADGAAPPGGRRDCSNAGRGSSVDTPRRRRSKRHTDVAERQGFGCRLVTEQKGCRQNPPRRDRGDAASNRGPWSCVARLDRARIRIGPPLGTPIRYAGRLESLRPRQLSARPSRACSGRGAARA